MGCDIHAHIEYRLAGDNYWSCFADPSMGRDYNLFGLLAGVRGGPPLYQPRGRARITEDASVCARAADRLMVLPDSEYCGQEGCCSSSDADRWTMTGLVSFIDDRGNYIYHPDHHSHHWLSLEELREVQDEYIALHNRTNPMLTVVIGTMAALEYAMECETRLVFWFDN